MMCVYVQHWRTTSSCSLMPLSSVCTHTQTDRERGVLDCYLSALSINVLLSVALLWLPLTCWRPVHMLARTCRHRLIFFAYHAQHIMKLFTDNKLYFTSIVGQLVFSSLSLWLLLLLVVVALMWMIFVLPLMMMMLAVVAASRRRRYHLLCLQHTTKISNSYKTKNSLYSGSSAYMNLSCLLSLLWLLMLAVLARYDVDIGSIFFAYNTQHIQRLAIHRRLTNYLH